MAQAWAMKLYQSREWRELRQAIIQERGLRCEQCGRLVHTASDLTADHIRELTPETVQDADIALNQDNVQLLCADCHNRKHQRFGHTGRGVFIVYGSPCSGKSTLVNQLKLRGDIIVDMDLLYEAISGCTLYDKPENIRQVVFRVRDTLLDAVRTRLGRWNNAYIIGGYPYKAKREALAKQLNAKLIYCESTREECLARAEERGVFASEWSKYVREWWNDYEP